MIAVTGVVLSAIYLLWGYQRAMQGPLPVAGGATSGHGNGSSGRIKDLELREYFVIVPIMAAILFIGIYPKPLLDRIQPTTYRIGACIELTTNRGPYGFPLPAGGQLSGEQLRRLACTGTP